MRTEKCALRWCVIRIDEARVNGKVFQRYARVNCMEDRGINKVIV